MHKFTPKTALKVVSEYYNISEKLIFGSCRKAEIVVPRHMGMAICYENMISPGKIAKAFNVDHTMPSWAWWKIESRCRTNARMHGDREKIRKLLTDGRKKVIQANASSVLSNT